ncbi:hypothetical protein [Microbacterium indicum]|uniref:hypothetical protein n=1 Tax=Microbacterium indicum TaxID=358100 RepID=UPI00048D7A11|nr:hypothetical protein [Microbacterium indicum]
MLTTGCRLPCRLFAGGLIVAAIAVTAVCSPSPAPSSAGDTPAVTDAAATPSSDAAEATPTAEPQVETSEAADYTALCEANSAATAAKAGTVGEDLAAVSVQLEEINALLPLQGVSEELGRGAEAFAESAAADIAVLEQFPADSLVSDVGLDPKFTESEALQRIASDPDYQAFVVWMIQECGVG